MPSSSSSSSSSSPPCRPVLVGPLKASLSPSPTRSRRPCRVLYPASRSRRPAVREAPDPARRGLLLLSLLVLLQICTEETLTCTELQTQNPEPGTCPTREGDGGLGTPWEEPHRPRPVGGALEHQMECVAA
ncbi:uncharacterized protein ACNS7B_010659 [Menidia menidia]